MTTSEEVNGNLHRQNGFGGQISFMPSDMVFPKM